MALILRYFTEFGSFRGALLKSGGGPGTEPGELTPDTPLHLTDLTRSRNTSKK